MQGYSRLIYTFNGPWYIGESPNDPRSGPRLSGGGMPGVAEAPAGDIVCFRLQNGKTEISPFPFAPLTGGSDLVSDLKTI